MIVSGSFNRFYHTIIKDFHSKAVQAKLYYKTEDELKQDLKDLNKDYPNEYKNGDVIRVNYIPAGLGMYKKKKSTAKLTDKELMQHIEFITMLAGEHKIVLDYAEREWERLMKECA